MATSIFSTPTDMTSNPAANILHRTPFPVAWCPWVPPTGVDAALSSMSWQHHFIAIKLKNIAIKCDELPLAFLAAYRGCLATKGGVADAASFPRAVRVIVRFNVRCEVSGRSRSLARSRRGRCLCVVRKSPKQIQVEEQSHHKFRQSHISNSSYYC